MRTDKVLGCIESIEKELRKLKAELFAPKDIKITAVNREDFSGVEFWKKGNQPQLVAHKNEKVDNETMKAWLLESCDYMSMISMPDFIEVEVDLEEKFFPPFLSAIFDIVGEKKHKILCKANINSFIRMIETYGINNNLQECKSA